MSTRVRSLRSARAMTLIELMVVVAIIGVLAAIGIAGYRKWFIGSKGKSEADDSMEAMATAIKSYYDNSRGYLDCSASFDDWYPMEPNDRKHTLNFQAHPKYPCWRNYNVQKGGHTYMSFAVRAGTVNDTPPTLPWDPTMTWNGGKTLTGPWFILVGTTDLDGDKVYARYVISSFQPGVILRYNEGE